MPASQVIKPAQQSQVAPRAQQQPRGQPTSFIILDDHQTEPSGLPTFTLTPTKHLNPPSIASATVEESPHNISGLPSFFGNIQSITSFQQIDMLQLSHQVTRINTRLSSNHSCEVITSQAPVSRGDS